MASQLSIGSVVRFTNPEDGQPDVGMLLAWEGGDLKIQNRDGVVYVAPSAVKTGGKSRKNRSSRRSSSRKSRRTNRVGARKTR